MAGPTHTLETWVLQKRPPAESFQTFTVFSAATGAILALQRISRKSTSTALDLFDQATLVLEEPSQGQAWFVKEARVQSRLTGVGKDYETLRFASNFASFVARNPLSEESRPAVFELLGQAFQAFAETGRPDVVYLKSVYRYCRDEGYPLKQAWVPSLPPADRAILTEVLNQPVAQQTAEVKVVARLQRRLEDFLRGETEILLE
jgi:recombinational DNA repair protein (RecF pathway)